MLHVELAELQSLGARIQDRGELNSGRTRRIDRIQERFDEVLRMLDALGERFPEA